MRRWVTALVLAAPLGCAGHDLGVGSAGTVDGGDAGMHVPPGPMPSGGATRPTAVPPPNACATRVPGPRTVRRLTAAEYASSLRDLFRDATLPTASIFDDPIVLGFTSDAKALVVKDLTAQQLMSHAETVARWAVQNHLSDLSACASTDAECRQAFVRAFGRRAFRAPLTAAQIERYDALFAAEESFADGAEAVIAAMLQSPSFLYRRELGTPDPARSGSYVLTQHEVAGALSYFLLGSLPDDELVATADAGHLSTPDEIDAQARRLLADPRSHDALMQFMAGWLGLGRLTSAVKDDSVFHLSDSLRDAMRAETALFVTDTVFAKDGTFADLLTAPYSFLDRELAQHYGIDAAVGSDFALVPYAGRRDPGILAHASILAGYATAATSSPVQRGKFVRTRLLCQALPPPPADADTNLGPIDPSATTRQRYEAHAREPSCASCHSLMDPIGYGFERYDGFGRPRDLENGQPIDASGTIHGVTAPLPDAATSGDVSFHGIGELATYLSTSDDVKNCMLRHWAYSAYGRASWDEDGCTYDAIRDDAAKNGFTMKSVALAIVHAPHFTRRVEHP